MLGYQEICNSLLPKMAANETQGKFKTGIEIRNHLSFKFQLRIFICEIYPPGEKAVGVKD